MAARPAGDNVMSILRWRAPAIAVTALVLTYPTLASAQLKEVVTVTTESDRTLTSPWYASGRSEAVETEWSRANLSDRITRVVSIRASLSETPDARLPIYLCSFESLQTRTTVRPYAPFAEVSFNQALAAYQTAITVSHGEFLANDEGCLKTGARGALLGYVVAPEEAGSYRRRFGGHLDPIVTCVRYGVATHGRFGDRDYVHDNEVCEQPLFAGFTTGVSVAQSIAQGVLSARYGRHADRDTIAPRSVRLVARRGERVDVLDPLSSNLWEPTSLVPVAGFAGAGSGLAWTSLSAATSQSRSEPCEIERSYWPAAAARRIGITLTPAGACTLANSIEKLDETPSREPRG